ncbi:MAG: hypothetical protein HQL98_00160 [Magnetococcales bacterium]|nr:hypothetical protein [Magnetococcales bacterium]
MNTLRAVIRTLTPPAIPMIQPIDFTAPLQTQHPKTLEAFTDLITRSPFLIGRRALGMNLFSGRTANR